MIGARTLLAIGAAAEADVKLEERLQGHYLTGALERSLELFPADSQGDMQAIELYGLDYIDNLEHGIPPDQIPVGAAYRQAILNYVILRFKVSGKKAQQIANRILVKHYNEGQPTAASFAYSKTGQRLNAVQTALQEHDGNYETIFSNGLDKEFDSLIDTDFPDITLL